MLVLLAGIFVVHIATVIMLFVCTIANVWVVSNAGNASVGLWNNCTNTLCNETLSYANQGIYKDIDPVLTIGVVRECSAPGVTPCPCSPRPVSTDALKTVQAFMILSIIFSAISLLVFVFQLFTMEKGNRFFLSGATMLVCWLCVLVGVSIYTNRYANGFGTNYGSEYHHGYSYILAWICFCFSFIIGVLYLVLRKK
uniref:Epithelial membrane protein 1 n=1 Tax=Papio anubis TaxID=9555 RepID=A0A8I5NA14_PAPAN